MHHKVMKLSSLKNLSLPEQIALVHNADDIAAFYGTLSQLYFKRHGVSNHITVPRAFRELYRQNKILNLQTYCEFKYETKFIVQFFATRLMFR